MTDAAGHGRQIPPWTTPLRPNSGIAVNVGSTAYNLPRWRRLLRDMQSMFAGASHSTGANANGGPRGTPRPAAVSAQDHSRPKHGPALLQVRSAGYRSKIWNTIWINAHIASRPSLPSLGGSGRRRFPVPRNTGLPHSHGTAPRQHVPVAEDAEEASEFGPGGHLTRDATSATTSWRYRPHRRRPSADAHGTRQGLAQASHVSYASENQRVGGNVNGSSIVHGPRRGAQPCGSGSCWASSSSANSQPAPVTVVDSSPGSGEYRGD
ncbi:hypothetical protein RKD27_007888 [Streptomyces sp. SAI-126]